ncbi:Ig-like domain-containing protein [Butyrivibrio sp. AC2005]|uniref:Ig-like domain-containing protein n=1 Tax=Butyrivibrio sp. AC2005 TaxID=1280672 RepID=UPI0004236C31|nr:Ig-like domain-containing protein [Butyrivibrio sp. AC2005]
MRKNVSLKRVMASAMAVVMAAALCVTAAPTCHVEAATKKVTVKLKQNGGDKDVKMDKGAKLQIKAKKGGKTLGKKSLKYSSSDKKIATVNSKGVITAKKNGEVDIDIEEKNGDYSATITVTVGNKNSGKKSDSIWLDAPSITLKVGQTFQAHVHSKPEGSAKADNVSWSSDNSEIATVSGGKITGVAEGNTVIYATKDGKTAAMQVIVTK